MSMNVSDYILNPELHAVPYEAGGFVNYTDYGRHGKNERIPKELVEHAIAAHRLGALFYAPFDGDMTATGEWGYTFLNLNGLYAGDGMMAEECGWVVNTPKDDEDALTIMRDWLFKQYARPPYNIFPGASGMASINGHTLFEHYVASWGYDYVGAEIGENIACYQAHMAFTRGAARQYGCKPIMYFSNWNQGTIGTYELHPTWPQGIPTGGHSMSILRRAYLMSYMGGAVSFTFEAGANLAFYGTERTDRDGVLELTPYGRMMQELVAFSAATRDSGIPYAPIAVVLDHYHGLALCSILKDGHDLRYDRAFGYFPNTAGDEMTRAFFTALYAGAGFFTWRDWYSQAQEEQHQLNTPYGDTHDVITHKASQEVLNSYPVLVLMGDIALTAEETKRYIAYVRQGGTLVCNTAYLRFFADYQVAYTGAACQEIPDGAGTVIVYGPDYSVDGLDAILKEQIGKFVPFTLSDEVEYLVNVKDGSLILTLINNEGVTKVYNEAPVTDPDKAKTVTVTYTGPGQVMQVRELYYGSDVPAADNAVTVTVGAGDVQVLEFTIHA